MRVLVITGMSGSGKSTAVRALEDNGFYCIDNLPVGLFKRFVDLLEKSGEAFKGVALVADIRGGELIKGYEHVFKQLTKSGHVVEIFYFDATDEALIRRFSETRRRHPAAENCTVIEGIRIERERLSGLRQIATRSIDTSELNVHQLRELILNIVHGKAQDHLFVIEVQSFGYRYGVPLESSIVMDVRFLPNPYFVPELKAGSGRDDAVREYVIDDPRTAAFMDNFFPLLDMLVPAHRQEGKSYLTISIGCTGGRHRSVAIAEATGMHLQTLWPTVRITHRDIEKGQQ
ncbi:RNase adapter RapZ [Geobacter sp. SVR]|uniref:RNase adapter RapZ n=1 Tax=Geobacter sp. SVR TaxID=2495594 RepID=UPI00143F0199|nr:RNase adapter RapZ [Geobacter sp. SVR]BCS53470.1 nucleotide-binding protein [Geobacter sp. SVR]GCF85403.1 nucleotide-binding protein [Geobacter sp. SVR]